MEIIKINLIEYIFLSKKNFPLSLEKTIRYCFESEGAVFAASEMDNHIGIIALENNLNQFDIACLFVLEKYRNKGIGSQLIDKAIEYSAERQKAISIRVESGNSIAGFLEKKARYNGLVLSDGCKIYICNQKDFSYEQNLNNFISKKIDKTLEKLMKKGYAVDDFERCPSAVIENFIEEENICFPHSQNLSLFKKTYSPEFSFMCYNQETPYAYVKGCFGEKNNIIMSHISQRFGTHNAEVFLMPFISFANKALVYKFDKVEYVIPDNKSEFDVVVEGFLKPSSKIIKHQKIYRSKI